MQAYPHKYRVQASLAAAAGVSLTSEKLPPLNSAAPAEFGGPGDLWSPETLLVAAVADCFVLSFQAIARASDFAWSSLRCEVEGVLDRSEGTTRFTHFALSAILCVDRDQSNMSAAGREREQQRAARLLQKAEQGCLITNSLKADTHLTTRLDINPLNAGC